MPYFRCRDIGVSCSFEAVAESEIELMKKIEEHAKIAHEYDPIPYEIKIEIRKAIKDNF
jgi:predicted small metal-binding protein